MLTRDELHAITEAMIQYGGSFVQALGAAFQRADPTNEAKLLAAFPELVEEYRELVALRRARP